MTKKLRFLAKRSKLIKKLQTPLLPATCHSGACFHRNKIDNELDEIDDEELTSIGNVWFPERDITNSADLNALCGEPLFLTGEEKWQLQEIRANTREIIMCKHFSRQFNAPMFYQFISRLLEEKKQYLEANAIAYPVTFYMWFSGFHDGSLCYNFISQRTSLLPFGDQGEVRKSTSLTTMIRKFFAFRRKKKATYYIGHNTFIQHLNVQPHHLDVAQDLSDAQIKIDTIVL